MSARGTRTMLVGATLAVAAALTLGGCGDEPDSATPGTSASGGPSSGSGGSATGPIVVLRTGGIAGVRDMVRVAPDGSARLTSKSGTGRACSVDDGAIEQLRAVDLTAVAHEPNQSPVVADGFSYVVSSGEVSATAAQGDDDGRRAELLDAAAAVVASCLGGQGGQSGGTGY